MQKASAQCPVDRLWISSMTEEAIKEGFAQLRPQEEYRGLYEAGLCRAIGDWLLGMNATRLYTLRYGGSDRKQPLSIGRVQTPTLALIVERQEAIENFKSETYWELKTRYREVIFSADKGKYSDKAKADAALKSITGEPFTITSVKKKDGKESAPKLFDLTSLQVACNRKFGMSAEETLATVQSLYEKKVTTYPRVDTTYLSEDLYPKVAGILRGLVIPPYLNLVSPLLSGAPIRKSKKVFDNKKVTDHHAIIPTGQSPSGLSETETKVFDLIARHFIAGVMKHAKALTAVCNPTVNSYKRLVPGYEAPVYIAWSARNRSPLIRIPESRGISTRIELRSVDPAANPYLAMAAILTAGLEGVKEKMEVPAAIDRNIYAMSARERKEAGIDDLPGTLNEAIEYLKQDETVQSALGSHILDNFIEAKRFEWAAYRSQVSQWELDQYLKLF